MKHLDERLSIEIESSIVSLLNECVASIHEVCLDRKRSDQQAHLAEIEIVKKRKEA